jgi:hypothetical protein
MVTKFEWRSPHSYIFVDVEGEHGGLQHWTIESESAILLGRLGWAKDLIKPGERIQIAGAPARNGSYTMRCRTVALSDGRKLPCFPLEFEPE